VPVRPSSSEFACDVAIEAGAAWVYDALTTAGGLSLWWGHRIEDDLRVGSAAELVLGGGCVLRIRVDELERPSRVVLTCVAGVAEWERSTLRFDLRGCDDWTLLRLIHLGWRWRVPTGELASSNFSWPRHLIRLRQLAADPTPSRDASSTSPRPGRG
jgi:uncharacterized protein YndB with AHSA1/START domain